MLAQRIDIFLQQSGLKYKELLELLDTYYINPRSTSSQHGSRKVRIQPHDPQKPDTCATNQLKLVGIDEDTLVKICRFVRLWRKLGWTMRELDQAITALNADLDKTFLVQLSHIQRLHDELKLPITTLVSWWGLIDTAIYTDTSAPDVPKLPSLYSQLFQNKAVINPLNQTFKDPNNLKGKLSEQSETITAALGISTEDFSLLCADENVIPQKNDTLSLENLSRLYRHATLAKAVKLSIKDYLAIRSLINRDPFPHTVVKSGTTARTVTTTAADTAATVLFVETVNKTRTSGFSIDELNYLLRHKFTATSGVAPTEENIAIILDEIRSGLQKIADENTLPAQTSDYSELTQKKLALLNWDSDLIEETIAALNTNPNHKVALTALPKNIVFPSSVKDKVAYNAATKTIRITGAMRDKEKTDLLNAASNPADSNYTAYRDAINELYQKSTAGIKKKIAEIAFKMRAFQLPTHSYSPQFEADLTALPSDFNFPKEMEDQIYYVPKAKKLGFMGLMSAAQKEKLEQLAPNNKDYQDAIADLYVEIAFPQDLKDKFYYDGSAGKLHFVGWMAEREKKQLRDLPSDKTDPDAKHSYQLAIDKLFKYSSEFKPKPDNQFLTANDAEELFYSDRTTEERFQRVLKKLLPYLRQLLSENLVVQKLSESLRLEVEATQKILKEWVNSPADAKKKAIAEFLDSDFATSNLKVKLTAKGFPNQFLTFIRLHKIAMVATKLELTAKQLQWVFKYGPSVKWLDLKKLPVNSVKKGTTSTAIFKGWERLVDLVQLRDSLSMGEFILSEIFNLAWDSKTTEDNFLKKLSELTEWKFDSVKFLHSKKDGFGFSFPDAYRDERALLRLQSCFKLLKRLGGSAKEGKAWANPNSTNQQAEENARSIKQAAKAKYEEEQWLNLAKPLRDILREKQRAALVAYLIAHPDLSQVQTWRDANDLKIRKVLNGMKKNFIRRKRNLKRKW